MEPSNEAKAVAEKLVSAIQDDDDVGIWGLYICGIRAESYILGNQARKDERDVKAQIAMAFDLHTAALRAEVERLREERDELKGWLKDKRFATENAWRAYRITQDYCNGAMSAFGEVLERLSE